MDLFVSDLDGTLLNRDQEVSKESADIINRLIEHGLNFTIATARSWDSTKDIIAPLNLKLPLILGNGAFIFDPVKKENILSNLIEPSLIEGILLSCSDLKLCPIIFSINNQSCHKVYYKSVPNKSIEFFVSDRESKGDPRFTLVDDFETLTREGIYSVAFSIEKEFIEDVCREFRARLDLLVHYHEDIYFPGFYWLEIASKNSSKRYAVEFLKEYLGANRLICFGDNLNDCSMFEAAHFKYAVDNANETLKKCATKVIGSNSGNGVARFLDELYKSGFTAFI